MNGHVFIIAEAGVNHNGSLDMALRMVDAAAKAGVDAVKFQTFVAARLASATAPKANYQEVNMPGESCSQLEMLRKLELRFDEFKILKQRCDKNGVMFMTTPFDIESADCMARLVDVFKVGSGDLDNISFLRHIAGKGKSVILSTGMGDVGEVGQAVRVFATARPSKLLSGVPPMTLLHCVTEYPCPVEHVNLKAMLTLRDSFGLPVGYSDHTTGLDTALAAAALGAVIIEKHFTLDRTLEGPDHKASIEPPELGRLVEGVRNVEKALGDGIKAPTVAELETRKAARKVIVASKSIMTGESFGAENLAVKRAGVGIPASQWDVVVGRVAQRCYVPDEPIEL